MEGTLPPQGQCCGAGRTHVGLGKEGWVGCVSPSAMYPLFGDSSISRKKNRKENRKEKKKERKKGKKERKMKKDK